MGVLRPSLVITGATGGMGKACARLLGGTNDLILTDIRQEPLTSLVEELKAEGYGIIGAEAGDLGDSKLIKKLGRLATNNRKFSALIHTAGLSPAQSDWRTILRVNSLVTTQLVDAFEQFLQDGTVAVLIASMAGHIDLGIPIADDIVKNARSVDDFESLQFIMDSVPGDEEAKASAAAGMAYVLSKRNVIRLCERKAIAWGARNARILSVSPGLIDTPMGRKEATANPQTLATIQAQPISRWGTASDIVAAVSFLISPSASFITGCDLRIDGGATCLSKR